MDGDTTRAIALCWLAHALRAAVARLTAADQRGVRLLCVGATELPALLRALPTGAEIRSVASVDELRAPATDDVVVVVCVDADERAWQRVQELLGEARAVVVGFSCHDATGLSLRVAVHPPTAPLADALRPLEELRRQCGLPLALELLAKLTNAPSRGGRERALLAAPVASQLPFQLLAMLLRWSFFHPRAVALLGKPFARKLALIPQPRVRHEITALYAKHARLWEEIAPDAPPLVNLSGPSAPVSHHFTLPQAETEQDEASLPPLQRLSQCALWDKQKQFYRDQGIHAWSHHLIPFGVSSSSYLAMQYARLAVDFLRHTVGRATTLPATPSPRAPNCFVWEAASGSCKFLHSFLLHFYELVERDRLEERFGLVPCVVASDLSEQVLESREAMACFQPYILDGRLDFAAFDTDTFLHSECETDRGTLFLRHAQVAWRVGQERGPVFVIGNYFFDSLRTDVFVVTQHESQDGEERATEIREARIDATTDNIPDMLFSLAKLEAHPRDVPVYAQSTANRTLVKAIDRLEEMWGSNATAKVASSTPTDARRVVNSSLILFPVEAIEFLEVVLHPRSELSGDIYPVAIVTGDATFSFRDAVPRSFVDEENGDLEIPQLSPHPDCFCLPVDLELLSLAVASAQERGSTAIVSTPSSDTFNVFLAHSSQVPTSSQQYLSQRLHDVLDQFTPCDCDLLWGLMSVDDGVKHLSSSSQLSLLAQTAWDFDVFTAIQWGLLRKWKKRVEESELVGGSDEEALHVTLNHERLSLVEAGRRSLRTMYVLDETSQSATTALTKLQIARWFYELRSFTDTKRILDSLTLDCPGLNKALIYLSGLVAYHQGDLWAALALFRKSQQLEPTRLRLKKWVARTLIRLQEAKQQSNT